MSFPLSPENYYGRIVVVGCTLQGDPMVLYGLTGRSDASKMRRIEPVAIDKHRTQEIGVSLRVAPLVAESLSEEERALLEYIVVHGNQSYLAVSNGRQTEPVFGTAFATALNTLMTEGKGLQDIDPVAVMLEKGLRTWTYEPDAHHTPRITALLSGHKLCMAILRRDDAGRTVRSFYETTLSPGKGHLMATYLGPDGDTLPSFSVDPMLFTFPWERAEDAARALKDSLSHRYLISVVAVRIAYDTHEAYVLNEHP